MTNQEQRESARKFINAWKNKGYEKGDTQRFWMSLLSDVLGMEDVADKIEFEKEVVIDGQTKFIDAYIKDTKTLIEQKSLSKDLNKQISQSGGEMMTPYEQAKNYANNLPVDEAPRWIVTSNFAEFHIYDMNKPGSEPEVVHLENLQSEIYRFTFLLNKKTENVSKEMEISITAGDIVGELYEELLAQYNDPENEDSLKSLNALCVRLVFCLYAEDAGIFGRHGLFHDYLLRFDIRDLRKALIDLFEVLDTTPETRDPYMDESLAEFPYVNGGLFSDTGIEIPQMTEGIRNLLLKKASEDFDWSAISPTIFGAVFESTLNPETRRSGGMHYTSIENIHKVIDPLFLDDFKEELSEIKAIAVAKTRKEKLLAFQEKLASILWLDPAAGSGNFLTESYLCIRRLENEVLSELYQGQIVLGETGTGNSPIKVSISQFYGIEINDFAVSVARAALWIAESQMMKETEDVVHTNLDFLPLKTNAHIVEGNALRMDWDAVTGKKVDYIMGNPPFVGGMMMTREQHAELAEAFPNCKKVGEADYVAGWYAKAAKLISGTSIKCAFVSTNSVCQGQSVANIWKPLFDEGVHIDFAYRTFRWDSEASMKAHVHCVIVGFSAISNDKPKVIYADDEAELVGNINGYLIGADDVFVENRSKPLCNVPSMLFGSMPRDGGGFSFTETEKEELINKEPQAEKWIHPYIGAEEFINNKKRYCLWLLGVAPSDLRSCPRVLERVERVRNFRAASKAAATRKFADSPTLFCQIAQPDTDYIIVPRVSSEKRRYVPIGFRGKEVIASDAVQIVPSATLYHFGVLTSNVHMAWMRAVCGRLKSDYRYSKDIVYNNFPWPGCLTEQGEPDEETKAKIAETAQGILDARALYPDASLADLYDPLTMPPELRKAHQANDREVMRAYGFNVKSMSESDCVAELMKMYQELTKDK